MFDAIADACGYVLDHGSSTEVPETGGRRPHLNILVQLGDLERRARPAMLDLGGTLSPESLRMLCCDAAVIPIVMDGKGLPLDVGRQARVVPGGVRRAVAARDRGLRPLRPPTVLVRGAPPHRVVRPGAYVRGQLRHGV